jgi:hypothetical protein
MIERAATAPVPAADSGVNMGSTNAPGALLLQPLLDALRPRPQPADRWEQHAVNRRGSDAGTFFDHECPPNGHISNSVWGTTIYADDSSICTAAVHEGLVTLAGGGRVRVFLHPGRNGYPGSGNNGVLTLSSERFGGSFAFTATIPEDVFPAPTARRDR